MGRYTVTLIGLAIAIIGVILFFIYIGANAKGKSWALDVMWPGVALMIIGFLTVGISESRRY